MKYWNDTLQNLLHYSKMGMELSLFCVGIYLFWYVTANEKDTIKKRFEGITKIAFLIFIICVLITIFTPKTLWNF